MSKRLQFEPEAFQVVSDLGQLREFANPVKTRLLRILQHREATVDQLAEIIDEPTPAVAEHIRSLCDLRMLTVVGQRQDTRDVADMYRATALIYQLRPDPAIARAAPDAYTGAMAAAAALDSVTGEVVTSLSRWPDQRANYEGRRTRLPYSRALEFNEKLVALVDEYWGRADTPAEEGPDDPLLAFVGFWYRSPDDQ